MTAAVTIDLDKNRLAEIPPSGGKPPSDQF